MIKIKMFIPIFICFNVSFFNLPVFAGNVISELEETSNVNLDVSQITSLSVDEALAIAISYNREIIELEEDLPFVIKEYEDLNHDLANNPDTYYSIKTQIADLKNTIDNNDLSVQKNKDILRYDITKLFISIVNAQKEIELQEKNLSIMKRELDISQIKQNKGILSESEFNDKNTEYIKKLNDAENKKIDLDNLYIDLNKALGIDLREKYSIELNFNYTEIGNIDIDEKIKIEIDGNFDITKQKQNLEVSEYEYSTYNENTSYISKLSKEKDIQGQLRDIKESEVNFSDSINKIYKNILSRETYDAKYNEELIYKQKELDVLSLKYAIGKATLIELDKKSLEIEELQNKISENRFEHYLLMAKFQNSNLIDR